MTLDVLLNTTRGPYTARRDVSTRAEACIALKEAFREAFGELTTDHEDAITRIRIEMSAASLPFTYRATAVHVTLSA